MHIRNEGDRVTVMAMVRVLSGRKEKIAAKKEIAAAIGASVYVLLTRNELSVNFKA